MKITLTRAAYRDGYLRNSDSKGDRKCRVRTIRHWGANVRRIGDMACSETCSRKRMCRRISVEKACGQF